MHDHRTPIRIDELYRTHAPAVDADLRRRCRCPELVADLVAATFEQAMLAMERDPDLRVGRGWLITVARRRLVDHIRRQERRRRVEDRLLAEERHRAVTVDPTDLRPDDDIVRALASLRAPHRRSLTLRYVEGRPIGEIADEMGCSYVAMESLLRRARTASAAALAPAADQPSVALAA